MQSISIIVADKQYLARLGLQHLLEEYSTFDMIEQSVKEHDLLPKIKKYKPNVVVLDYNQPGNFSVETVAAIRQESPQTNILIISDDDEKTRIDRVLEEGVNSFLTRCCDKNEIVNAINATAKGERYFCNNVLNHLLEKSYPKQEESPSKLSNREKEIVELIATGLVAKEIAAQLHLSTHTVYTHRKNIMKKLQLNSVSELVLYAVNEGLVTDVGNG